MSTHDTDTLLAALEREQRRLRQHVRWLTVGLGLTLALLLVGEALPWRSASRKAPGATPGELRATRLLLTDEEGRVRAELGLAPDAPEPHLAFYHPDGRRWAALVMAPPPGAPEGHEQAALLLHDEDGEPRVSLGASNRDSGLVLYGPRNAPGLALYVSPDSQGLVISDGEVPRMHLRYNQHDDAQLSELVFQDEQKRTQAALRGGRGGVSLEFYRPDGERAFLAP